MANGGVFFWLTKLESHGGQWTWAVECYFCLKFSFSLKNIFKIDGDFTLI